MLKEAVRYMPLRAWIGVAFIFAGGLATEFDAGLLITAALVSSGVFLNVLAAKDVLS